VSVQEHEKNEVLTMISIISACKWLTYIQQHSCLQVLKCSLVANNGQSFRYAHTVWLN